MRMFTVYPQKDDDPLLPRYSIRATHREPAKARLHGSLLICSDWPRERVLEQFRRLGRYDAVARLARGLGEGAAVTIEMRRPDLEQWNYA